MISYKGLLDVRNPERRRRRRTQWRPWRPWQWHRCAVCEAESRRDYKKCQQAVAHAGGQGRRTFYLQLGCSATNCLLRKITCSVGIAGSSSRAQTLSLALIVSDVYRGLFRLSPSTMIIFAWYIKYTMLYDLNYTCKMLRNSQMARRRCVFWM